MNSSNQSEKFAYESLSCRAQEIELQGVLCASHGSVEEERTITGGLDPYTGKSL